MRTAFPLLALLLAACGPSAVTLATEGFLVTATSGPEQVVALTTYGDTFGPEGTSSLPLLRTCDTAADYAALVTAADADADGELSESEAEDAMAAQRGGGEGHGHGPRGGHWLDLLRLVYDVDQDGAFSEEEMTALFEDFTARCEVLQASIVTRFDVDDDGAISDAELAVAQATLAAEAEALRGTAADDVDGDMDGPEGDHDGDHGGGPGGDHDGDGHGHDVFDFTIVPEAFSAWDTDASGTWSGTELETFRADLRERIRTGAAILPPPPVVDTGADTAATDTGSSDTGATDTGAADTGSDTASGDTSASDTGDTGAAG